MAVYLINSYDIVDVETFKNYGPQVLPILKRYGAKVLASDVEGMALEGSARTMNAIISFPTREAVFNCYRDSEYQEVMKVRLASTKNCTMVVVQAIG